jgi:hypothetical protein
LEETASIGSVGGDEERFAAEADRRKKPSNGSSTV